MIVGDGMAKRLLFRKESSSISLAGVVLGLALGITEGVISVIGLQLSILIDDCNNAVCGDVIIVDSDEMTIRFLDRSLVLLFRDRRVETEGELGESAVADAGSVVAVVIEASALVEKVYIP